MCHVFEALNTVIDVKIGSCFTDSTVALFWIQGEGKQWKQFVHNRVTAIRPSTTLGTLCRERQPSQLAFPWCFDQGLGEELDVETWSRLATQVFTC